ncbi:MAG TPA: branched-chain amino acid ABC transporter permease [Gaiellaceae bacterium]|nr:branched-chain amino acid ABC transporter permease [Gaiellaceae bacterium]
MQQFFQQVVSGLADGSVYGSLALALVLIYRATHIINFAQGEMGMFSTYILWALVTHHGMSYWPAFVLVLVISFFGGIGVHRAVIRPLERAPELTIVMATIALLVILNGLASWIWGPEEKIVPSPFPNDTWDVGGVKISQQSVGVIGITLGCVVVLWLFFQFTKAGLALRASAVNAQASRVLGVRVSWMLALGWGLAAVLSAISGMMAAASFYVFTPSYMQGVLIYAFAAAVLGGLESPAGAVVGGLALGVTINLLGHYIAWIGSDLQLPVALAALLTVLLVRPGGLFGRVVVRRV